MAKQYIHVGGDYYVTVDDMNISLFKKDVVKDEDSKNYGQEVFRSLDKHVNNSKRLAEVLERLELGKCEEYDIKNFDELRAWYIDHMNNFLEGIRLRDK